MPCPPLNHDGTCLCVPALGLSEMAMSENGLGKRRTPSPRKQIMCAAVLNDALFVFGGWDPEAPGSGGSFKDEVCESVACTPDRPPMGGSPARWPQRCSFQPSCGGLTR